ncbi:phage holin family protein [Candidatus Microgenomates bacterium]|nr:phage holin family protein [Candidatus Microgenomates bacterium]
MKKVLRLFFISLLALWLTSELITGFTYRGGLTTLIWAAGIFAAMNLFVRPLLRLFFLPLNVVTMGFFSWVVNIIVLYLLTIVVTQVKVRPFDFPGMNYQGFTVPAMHIGFLGAFVVATFTISFIESFFNWLAKS